MGLYRTINCGWVFYPYFRDGDTLVDPHDLFFTREEQVFRKEDIGTTITKDHDHLRPSGRRRERGVLEVASEVVQSSIDEIRE